MNKKIDDEFLADFENQAKGGITIFFKSGVDYERAKDIWCQPRVLLLGYGVSGGHGLSFPRLWWDCYGTKSQIEEMLKVDESHDIIDSIVPRMTSIVD